MFHNTQYLVGEAHTKRVGPALVAASTWQDADGGEAPALDIIPELAACVYRLDAILVTGPTRTASTWIGNLKYMADLAVADTIDIAEVVRIGQPDLRWRCITLDEVGTRTRVLLVNGVEPIELDVDRHSDASHEADAVLHEASYGGAPHASACEMDLAGLVDLGVFLR